VKQNSPLRRHVARPAPITCAFVYSALVLLIVGGAGCRQKQATPAADDPIRPNGVKRSRAEIVQFMESEVMPFARRTLEPVVGMGKVRCETCHGEDAEARNWTMPAIAALPEPDVRRMAESVGSDSQLRNALHGYSAEEDKQRVATHMRGDVLPGMAKLLKRPAYDFTQSYEYNVQRGSFGCYHCHMVKP
jgi:hypothetical protein